MLIICTQKVKRGNPRQIAIKKYFGVMKSAEPVIEIDLEIVRLLEDKQTAAAAAAGETLSNR
jgi:hypothetical protein